MDALVRAMMRVFLIAVWLLIFGAALANAYLLWSTPLWWLSANVLPCAWIGYEIWRAAR